MECDVKSSITIPNYKLFSEDEKNEMIKYNGPLPEDNICEEEKMIVNEELPERNPNGFRLVPALRRLRRNARLIPPPTLEPHGEDEVPVMEETTEEYLEELKLSVDTYREKLEKKIVEHLIQHNNEQC